MDPFRAILWLFPVFLLSVNSVTTQRRSLPRDPLRDFNGLKSERGSRRPNNLLPTQCSFRNGSFTLGEKWSPDFGAEFGGVQYCIICECIKSHKKNRRGMKKLRTKVHCRHFENECPKEHKCQHPKVHEGRCCKSCSSDDEFERNIRKPSEHSSEKKGNRKRNFFAVLSEINKQSDSTDASRVYLHLLNGSLSFILETAGTQRPTFIRFHDLNDTILQEFAVKGNTSLTRNYKVHGLWQHLIEEHKRWLASNALKISISFNDDEDAESQLIGVVHRFANKDEMNQKISHLKRHKSVYLRAMKPPPPTTKMLRDEAESQENSIEFKSSCTHQGRQYEEGEQWLNLSDNCETCTCQRGQIRCESEVCLSLNCTMGQVQPEGQCCPICRESLRRTAASPAMCDFSGRKYPPGAKWHPYMPPNGFDLCVTCTCTANAVPHCERFHCPPMACAQSVLNACCQRRCPKSSPEDVPPLVTINHPQYDQAFNDPIEAQRLHDEATLSAGGCRHRKQIYPNGAQWHPTIGSYGSNKCILCSCKNGHKKCDKFVCKPQRDCKNLVTRSSECCPVCLDDQPSSRSSRRSSKKV